MLISFVIPFYGSVPLLRRTLDSLAAQTDGDFEAIVVDDEGRRSKGEGRRADELVRTFDARFRYVRQAKNLGPYQARVRGVEEARGTYVVDVDCDDYVLPELVAELRQAIGRSHGDIVVYNVEQDADGVITPHWCRYEPGTYTPQEVMDRMVGKKLQWNYWSKAIRREVILKTWEIEPGLRTTRVLAPDDFCAVVPMVLCSEKIDVIPYVGYRYWQGAQSICRQLSVGKVWRAIRDTHEVRRLVLAFARKNGCSSDTLVKIRLIARLIARWWVREWLHAGATLWPAETRAEAARPTQP